MSEGASRDGVAAVTATGIENLMNSVRDKASKAHDRSAKTKFNAFLREHVSRDCEFDGMESEQVTDEIMGQFATYLLEDECVQWQTSMNYLSSIRRQLEVATRIELFKSNEDCYMSLRTNLSKQLC